MDETSRSIGELQGHMSSLQLSHTSSTRAILSELKTIRDEQTTLKVDAAKVSIKMGIGTAIVVLGFVEGIKYYIKSHGGS